MVTTTQSSDATVQPLGVVTMLSPQQQVKPAPAAAQSSQQQQQSAVPQPSIVFPTPVTVPLLSPVVREIVSLPMSPAATPLSAPIIDSLSNPIDVLAAAAVVHSKTTATPLRPRHASLSALPCSEQTALESMDASSSAVVVEAHDPSMHSPAFSATSTTPVVGDYYESRSSSSRDVTTADGLEEKRRKMGDDSGVVSMVTDGSSDVSRFKSDNNDSKNGAYHFKKDIKWRFTADADKALASALKDSAQGKEHSKSAQRPLPNSASEYGSDFSGNNSNDNGNGSKGSSAEHADCSSVSTGYSSNGNSSSSSTDASLNNTVPAFALHPMGVYYIPIVLPVAQVMPFMKNHRSMGICHPISIPVSFTGPFHMGIPHATANGLTASDINSEVSRSNKFHHRHLRHGASSRRNHSDGRSTHARRDGSKRAS